MFVACHISHRHFTNINNCNIKASPAEAKSADSISLRTFSKFAPSQSPMILFNAGLRAFFDFQRSSAMQVTSLNPDQGRLYIYDVRRYCHIGVDANRIYDSELFYIFLDGLCERFFAIGEIKSRLSGIRITPHS